MPVRDRVGVFRIGDTSYPIRLARWRETPYRPLHRLVWPQLQNIPGAEGKVASDPFVRQWAIWDFHGGEGNEFWREGTGKYNRSQNVTPNWLNEGLSLGPLVEETQNDAAATFAGGDRFGRAHGKLWAASGADQKVTWWQNATDDWDATGWSLGETNTVTSLVDRGDKAGLVVAHATSKKIYHITNAAAVHADGISTSYAPVLTAFDGNVYFLDGDSLSRIDSIDGYATTWTETSLVDLSTNNNWHDNYLVDTSEIELTYNRLTTSDVGPLWYRRLDDGEVWLWEYNVADDSEQRLGKLPVDMAFPYSIYWANGYAFVGFRYADSENRKGPAYIYFQRGSQRGVVGPIREVSTTSASRCVLLAGMVGDDLVFYYDGQLWAYNLSRGAIYQLGLSDTTERGKIHDAVTFGKDVFISNVDDAERVQRFDRTQYNTSTSNWWYSGRFDFSLPGVEKLLLDVTIVTDPLPVATSVNCYVRTNGGATWTQLKGTFKPGIKRTDELLTQQRWTASTKDTPILGRDFEIRLDLFTTDSTVTPRVTSITSRAVSAERQRQWVLELDVGEAYSGGEPRSSSHMLAGLDAVSRYSGIVEWENPWGGAEHDDPVWIDGFVEQAELMEGEPESDPYVAVVFREAPYG